MMRKAQEAPQPSDRPSSRKFSAIDYLALVEGREVELARRTEITKSCPDTLHIPKVSNAGKVVKSENGDYQIMHNGVKIAVDSYYGDWSTKLIKDLRGHHEPQEEKVFYELSKHFRPGSVMMELGAYWAYYSLWFHYTVKGALNICCEPDPVNLEIGKRNFELNGFDNVRFVQAAAGGQDGKIVALETENSSSPIAVPIRTVDSLVEELDIKSLEVLHLDIQGIEYDALRGAERTIKDKKLRFVFVSTHHYLISRDPDIHQKCLDYIKQHGGHVICEHEIHESFSGDGLIVASFDPKDKDLQVDVSLNRMSGNQFRPYTKDLELAFGAYELQLGRLNEKSFEAGRSRELEEQVNTLQRDIEHLKNLNIKGSVKQLLKAVYRSLRFRALKLIWGTAAGYKNTADLEQAAGSDITSADAAKGALEAIVESDRQNTPLLFRSSPVRKFIFEILRRLVILLRKLLKRGGGNG